MTREKTFASSSVMLLPVCLARLCQASSGENVADFDTDLLLARGFPSEVAHYFRDRSHFLPGTQPASLSINGLPAQTIELRFNEEGFPCFDKHVWEQLHLYSEQLPSGCLEPGQPLRNLQIGLTPSRSSVQLLVLDRAMLSDADGFVRGGHAVLFNYDIQASQSKFRSDKWNYLSARLEPGINAAGWLFRSKGYYSRFRGRSRYRKEDAYIARSVAPLSATFQAGRFASNALSWGGLPLIGAQITSDVALAQQSSSTAVAAGIVQTQAIAEIRQHGQLRYRTLLSPGPFELSSIPGLIPGIDMEVEIVEENGQRQTQRIPVPPGTSYAAQATSFQLGAGRYLPSYRPGNNGRHSPNVLTMEWSAPVNSYTGGTVGGLWAQGYRAAAITVNASNPAKGRNAGLSLRASKAQWLGSGVEISANGSMLLSERWVTSMSLLTRSRNFATPEDGLRRLSSGAHDHRSFPSLQARSLTSSLGWISSRWGTYTYALTSNRPASSFTPSRHAFTAHWKMRSSTWNLTAQHDGNQWHTVLLNVDIPWGNGRWRHSAQANENYRSVTTNYANSLPGQRGSYRIQAMQDNFGQGRLGAHTSLATRFAHLGASLSAGPSAWYGNANASGGVVWTDRNMLFSPIPLEDTFAVIRYPDLVGLRLRGPGGTTITNERGYVVVPRLSPYRKQTASIDGRSIPVTYRVASSTVELSPARGSVIHRTINASRVRQLILTISMPDGRPVTQGSAVFDVSGHLVSTVVGSGNVMLTNEQIGAALKLKTNEGQICELDYQPPERFDPNRPFEESNATCG